MTMQQDIALTRPNDDSGAPLETESTRLRNFSLVAFCLLFIGFGGWLYFANIAGAIIVSGTVNVQGKPQIIQHLDGGIVAEINVTNGSQVKPDELLIRLDETTLRSNLDIYINRLGEAAARRDRLVAERDGKNTIEWDDLIFERLGLKPNLSARTAQAELRTARRSTTRGQSAQIHEQVSQLENQIQGLRALEKSKTTQRGILESELSNMRELQEKGFASENSVLTLERQIESLSGQIAEHGATVLRLQNSISETKIRISQIDREFNQQAQSELSEVDLNLRDVEQQVIATQAQLSRTDIRAPVAGIVHELGVFTLGGVVPPGGVMMQIIPQDRKMEFEVNVEPQFIDQIYPGQKARVMFSAFNTRTTPELNGEVARVSPNTVVTSPELPPYYLVNVSVSEEELARLNGQSLVPGMPVEVFITTQSRSPLNYLLKPLTDNFRRSLREE